MDKTSKGTSTQVKRIGRTKRHRECGEKRKKGELPGGLGHKTKHRSGQSEGRDTSNSIKVTETIKGET